MNGFRENKRKGIGENMIRIDNPFAAKGSKELEQKLAGDVESEESF